MKRRWIGAALVATACVAPAHARSVAADDPIEAGYRLLYDGDKAAAQRHFERLLAVSPDALPARFGELVADNARLRGDAALQASFEKRLDAFLALAEKRYGRSRQDSEALLYLSCGYMMRAGYRVDYDKGMWGAARDGSKAKGYVDIYVRLHPEHTDGFLVLGMYNYYADIAPAFAHLMRFLLALPKGNRAEGLKQIERVASQGNLFAAQAQMMLVDIYSSYENRPADAVAMGERLQRQHPANDDASFALADAYGSPTIEDREKAAAVYQAIIARRQHDESLDGLDARYRALMGLAATRWEEWRCAEAIATLTTVIDARPNRLDWVLPQFLLQRANYRMLLIDPHADEDAKRVQADPQFGKWKQAATDRLTAIAARKGTNEAAMYARLIPANRLVVEEKLDEARRLYAELGTSDPQSVQLRYRLALLDFASNNLDRARPAFATLAASKSATDGIRAWCMVYTARIDDLAGKRDAARLEYQKVADDYDKQARQSAAARIGLVTPYRRPVTKMVAGGA